MSRLKNQNVVSFWRQSLQTSKNYVPWSNQKWKETNVNLREMLCVKYTQALCPIASASAEIRPYTMYTKNIASELVKNGRKQV